MARKYGKKTSAKVERTMHEWKRGKLRSGSGGKVTSRKQAIAIGLSQARARGYKVPPAPSHATMSADEKVRAYLERMRHDQEIDARGMARALRIDPWEASYALERAAKSGFAVTDDGRWFGPASGGARGHHAAKKKSPAQLDREIDEALGGGRGRRSHATVTTGKGSIYAVEGSKFAVEIDPAEFDSDRPLPTDARWRNDLAHLAEKELAGGRSYRRPKLAVYNVVEWTGYRGAIGKLIDWLDAAPGITRYAEVFE